jgi:hypothetical protein
LSSMTLGKFVWKVNNKFNYFFIFSNNDHEVDVNMIIII